MNKEKIVSELDAYMKGINDKLSVEDRDGDLVLTYDKSFQAYFSEFDAEKMKVYLSDCYTAEFVENNYLGKFYRKAIKLMDEYGSKYTIKVLPCEYGYLYKRDDDIDDVITDLLRAPHSMYRRNNLFTECEIKKLKKLDSVAIDWDKAIIKEVSD